MNNKELQAIIEGLLFIKGDDGISMDELQDALINQKPSEIRQVIDELNTKYAKDDSCAFSIQKFGGKKFRLQTKPILHQYLMKLANSEETHKLSNSIVEVLSIVAYQGPLTKGEIDDLRNSDSAYQLQKLRERKLVKAVGKSEENPRANIYQITENFYKIFNINGKDDMPIIDLDEVKSSQEMFEDQESKTQNLKNIFQGAEAND
jgi:segregation and condensation protein B